MRTTYYYTYTITLLPGDERPYYVYRRRVFVRFTAAGVRLQYYNKRVTVVHDNDAPFDRKSRTERRVFRRVINAHVATCSYGVLVMLRRLQGPERINARNVYIVLPPPHPLFVATARPVAYRSSRRTRKNLYDLSSRSRET